jgi:hypothetical protein
VNGRQKESPSMAANPAGASRHQIQSESRLPRSSLAQPARVSTCIGQATSQPLVEGSEPTERAAQ